MCHRKTDGHKIWIWGQLPAPGFLAAAVVVAAAAVAFGSAHQTVVATTAEQEQQDDDPPAAVIAHTIVTHKNTSDLRLAAEPLIPRYSSAAFL